MLKWFKSLFSRKLVVDFAQLIRDGAKVIDVRSKAEFASGHVKGSMNIPLDQIAAKTSRFGKNDVLIVCCRSGSRSASALRILKGKGYQNVYNAGAWMNLRNL